MTQRQTEGQKERCHAQKWRVERAKHVSVRNRALDGWKTGNGVVRVHKGEKGGTSF